MKVLILGGTGFIGSHLVDACIARGYSVRVVSRGPEHFRQPVPQVDYRIGDLSDENFIGDALEDMEVVVHAASTTTPGPSNKNPKEDVQSNLVATIGLLDQMVKHSVRRIIFLSSGGTVYGNPQIVPIQEKHPLEPLSSYGIVKGTIEKYLTLYQQLHGIQPLILRPSNVYGPRHGHIGVQGVISTFLYSVLKNKPLTVWGDGSIVRDYVYVDDCIALLMKAIPVDTVGIFNVGAGEGYSINEVIKTITQVVGKKLEVDFKEGRTFDAKSIVLDIDKVKKTFQWSPKISLETGVKNVWEWMKQLKDY